MITIVSKGEADLEAIQKAEEQRRTTVIYKNTRTGRKVTMREYEARKMVKRGEGTIVKVLGLESELKKERIVKRKKVEALEKARLAKANKAEAKKKGE